MIVGGSFYKLHRVTVSYERNGVHGLFESHLYETGDAGETSLGDGARVRKTHARIGAYGGVDELNSVIGVALTVDIPDQYRGELLQIQNDLFDLGADLCVPETDVPPEHPPLRVVDAQVERLERLIDELNELLTPLESFILPGGSRASAYLHQARTVCRRVERDVVSLCSEEIVNPHVVVYLNRLSDLLFVMARACNDQGASDRLWEPGQGAQ